MSRWYYTLDNRQRLGPVTSERLRQLVLTGTIRPGCMVMPEGGSKWIPASKVRGLFPKPAPPAAAPVAAVLFPCPKCGRAIPLQQRELSLIIECARCGARFVPSQARSQAPASSVPLNDLELLGLVKDTEPAGVAPDGEPPRTGRINGGSAKPLSTSSSAGASPSAELPRDKRRPTVIYDPLIIGLSAVLTLLVAVFALAAASGLLVPFFFLLVLGGLTTVFLRLNPLSRRARPFAAGMQLSSAGGTETSPVAAIPAAAAPAVPAAFPASLPWYRNPAWLFVLGLVGVACVTTIVVLTARGDIYDRELSQWRMEYAHVLSLPTYQWERDAVLIRVIRAREDAEAYWAVAGPVRFACIVVCLVVGVAFVVASRIAYSARFPQR